MYIKHVIFQSTRPSRASTIDRQGAIAILQISIHKALAGLDPRIQLDKFIKINFNPQGPRGPRPGATLLNVRIFYFNPQGPRGPRLPYDTQYVFFRVFQSTRPSRASTFFHSRQKHRYRYFNPQGPRGPRQ